MGLREKGWMNMKKGNMKHLIKKLDLPESEDTQHNNAIPSHNSSGNMSPSEEFSATTHAGPIDDLSLPVITNNHDIESKNDNKETDTRNLHRMIMMKMTLR